MTSLSSKILSLGDQPMNVVIFTTLAVFVGATAFLLSRRRPAVFLDKTHQNVTLEKKENISQNIIKFTFKLDDESQSLGLPTGKHIRMYCPNTRGVEAGKWNGREDPDRDVIEAERKYTPVSGNELKGMFELILRIYRKGEKEQFPDGGKMSQYLESCNVGDKVKVLGPIGLIEYKGMGRFQVFKKELTCQYVCMIAGGTGLTPMLQVINAILKNPADRTKISLIYANQTEDDIICRAELDAYAKSDPDRFNVWYTIERAGPSWKYSTGFVTADMIKQQGPAPAPDVLVLMCGPPPMIRDGCRANLKKLGFDSKSLMEF